MNSINIKEKDLLQEWAKRNGDNSIFEKEAGKDSYFVERGQDLTEIWNYQFSTIGELKNIISAIIGSDIESDLEKLIVVSAFKCKNLTGKISASDVRSAEQENDEKIPEYIYVF